MSAIELAGKEGSEFTSYAGFRVEYRDASHRYWLIKDGKREPAVSVTSALKVLDKPALLGWAERMGAEGALWLEREGGLTYPNGDEIPISEAIKEVRSQGLGADAKRDAGGDRGNALHEAQRIYCETGTVPNVGDFDPEHRGYVSGYCAWLLRDEPEPIFTERVVGSVEHSYAGRVDMLAKIKGRIVLPDLKTAGRAYPEQHLQVGGYMGALAECSPEIEVDEGMILLVGADGSFATHPCLVMPGDFLAVLACHRTMVHVRNMLRGAEKAEARRAVS
jgi:genome maintenance exonuclease 1